jgi:regulator of sigma E protease
MLLSFISFIAVFTVIALTHELGHLVFAKKVGVRVYELALGFGPRVFSWTRNQTRYSINLIPILGYVKIAGEGENEEDSSCPEEEKFYNKSPREKLKALAAGPSMNILTAFIILSTVFLMIGVPSGLSDEIAQVSHGSPAELAGLKPGDKIISINGKHYLDMTEAVSFIHQSANRMLTLKVKRKGTELTIKAKPKYNPRLKVALLGFSLKPTYVKVNPIVAIYRALEHTIALVILTLGIIFQLVAGKVSLADLAGPVGIAQVTGRYAEAGLLSFLYFTSLISVNVGVLNLLPIPALDGGHIAFVFLEMIRKKKIDPKLENKINYWGLVALLILMGLITINDFLRLFRSP